MNVNKINDPSVSCTHICPPERIPSSPILHSSARPRCSIIYDISSRSNFTTSTRLPAPSLPLTSPMFVFLFFHIDAISWRVGGQQHCVGRTGVHNLGYYYRRVRVYYCVLDACAVGAGSFYFRAAQHGEVLVSKSIKCRGSCDWKWSVFYSLGAVIRIPPLHNTNL